MVPGPRDESKRSDSEPARTSRERVARRRTSSVICQSMPPFQAHTPPLPSYSA